MTPIIKKARNYRLASTFLSHLKANGVTYEKLKPVLFGRHAIAFIKAVRKHGQKAFTETKKAHHFMYMVETAIDHIKPTTDECRL